jgi:thymidylate synthase
MALPPCHMICQFNVRQGKYLSCALFQRSGDVGLGVPFNIASYSMLTHLLAAHCGLIAEDFVHFIGNCHIYEEHVFALSCQLERESMDFPKIRITSARESIEEYTMDDIEWITPYTSHGPIRIKMSA